MRSFKIAVGYVFVAITFAVLGWLAKPAPGWPELRAIIRNSPHAEIRDEIYTEGFHNGMQYARSGAQPVEAFQGCRYDELERLSYKTCPGDFVLENWTAYEGTMP